MIGWYIFTLLTPYNGLQVAISVQRFNEAKYPYKHVSRKQYNLLETFYPTSWTVQQLWTLLLYTKYTSLTNTLITQ